MRRAGGLALRHPRAALLAWLVATVALAAFSPTFDDRVAAPSIDVPGTPSAQAQDAAARYFGVEASIPILLEGPEASIARQGRELAAVLKEDPTRRVLTPWDEGQSIPELRPRPNAALLLVVAEAESTFAGETGSAVRDRVDDVVEPPVRASVSGFSVVGADLTEASLQGARDAEVIAIPVLLLVLLLVFRSPIAALIPAVFGFAAVQSGFGAVALMAEAVTITDVAGPLTSMMGLALGVDYSLLLVSRFREHLAAGLEPRAAAAAAQAGAGRTVIVAAMTLLVAMLVAIALSPGDFLLSMAVSVALVATISMFGSYLAVPALLSMVGARIDAWRIGGAQRETGRWGQFATAVQRRPVAWGVAASAPLVILSVLALGLDTGPPDVRGLPGDTRARVDAERMAEVLGPGWVAPFEIFVSDEKGPVTTPGRLRAMEDWQRRAARIEGVRTVIGPGEIVKRQPALLRADRTLRRTSRSLAQGNRNARRLASGLQDAEGGAGRLAAGLRRARDASERLDAGADQGSAGARRLADALGDARQGAEELRAGVRRARDGSRKLRDGIRRARSGSGQLASGARRARRGAALLSGGAAELAGGLRAGQGKIDQLRQAATDAERDAQQLLLAMQTMTVGRADPLYNRALQSAGRLWPSSPATTHAPAAASTPSTRGSRRPSRRRVTSSPRRPTERTGSRAERAGCGRGSRAWRAAPTVSSGASVASGAALPRSRRASGR
jgi:RND superfamily putative drug exporter